MQGEEKSFASLPLAGQRALFVKEVSRRSQRKNFYRAAATCSVCTRERGDVLVSAASLVGVT